MSANKVLLLEGIHPRAQERLEQAGFQVEMEKGALDLGSLKSRMQGVMALGIRSKTQLPKELFYEAPDLRVVGAFCIGTNQVDLESSNQSGIPVFNAPYSNTRSVAELVIGEMIALSRRMGDISRAAHEGCWLKSASGAHEVRGKTLGIVGYGHIGTQVSVLAEAMGLKVIYYDIIKKLPLGNAHPVEHLEELFTQADFVSLHVPETPQTKNMIGAQQLALMKPGAYFMNASRGTVVDISALAQALKLGRLAGAAVDVFPQEPKGNNELFVSELQGIDNVILTPHIGGSTEEAQEAIGIEVSESLVRYLTAGSTTGAVNFPQIEVPPLSEGVHRILNVHQNKPGVLSEINTIVSRTGANIKAQYLSTDPHIGYLILDMEGGSPHSTVEQIQAVSTSIQTRALF